MFGPQHGIVAERGIMQSDYMQKNGLHPWHAGISALPPFQPGVSSRPLPVELPSYT